MDSPPPDSGSEPVSYVPPPHDTLATTSLVLGLLGLFCLGPLTGIPAIICGHLAGRRIAQSQGRIGGSGMALAGFVLGCLSTLAWIAGGILVYRKVNGVIGRVGEKTAEVQTRIWVYAVESRIDEYYRIMGAWPTPQRIRGEEIDPASTLIALEAQAPRENQIPNDRIRNGVLVDHWNRPLHLAVDLDGDGSVLSGAGQIDDTSVLVWSDGPNGRNEFGSGDDIRSW